MNYLRWTRIVVVGMCVISGGSVSAQTAALVAQSGSEEDAAAQPRYTRTSFAHESEVLKNGCIQLSLFKRLSGWGWGEIRTSPGKFTWRCSTIWEKSCCEIKISPCVWRRRVSAGRSTGQGERLGL